MWHGQRRWCGRRWSLQGGMVGFDRVDCGIETVPLDLSCGSVERRVLREHAFQSGARGFVNRRTLLRARFTTTCFGMVRR